RYAGSVQVVGRAARGVYVRPRVLFQGDARQPDALQRAVGERHVDVAAGRERLFVLRYLITLGEVGVEVVLAREAALLVDRVVRREGREHRHLDGGAVQDGERPREPQRHRAGRRVRL